jgi:methyl acetate hydrolase
MGLATDLDQILSNAVDVGDVPGVIALVACDAGVIYEGAFGVRELGKPARMSLDTVVWLASMTKLVTCVAAMQVVEQGRVGLDNPLTDLLPAIATVQVLDGFDEDGMPRLRPPKRPITLRHLLTHTAGFGYHIWNANILRYQQQTATPPVGESKFITLQGPLLFDPGDRWEYGINIEWVGQLVERISGLSLEAYFREHLFDQLGMVDSGFILGPERRERVASVHDRQHDGTLLPNDFVFEQDPEFFAGGASLYSTGPDYLRLLRMLLAGGTLDGARILRPETVAHMGTNQIGNLTVQPLISVAPEASNDFEPLPGIVKKWGLGYFIATEDAPTGRAGGSLAWAGLPNAYYWIDPMRRVTGTLLTQILPFGDARVLELLTRFERAIYGRLAN